MFYDFRLIMAAIRTEWLAEQCAALCRECRAQYAKYQTRANPEEEYAVNNPSEVRAAGQEEEKGNGYI